VEFRVARPQRLKPGPLGGGLAARLNVVPFPVGDNAKFGDRDGVKIKIKVKSNGQECPFHQVLFAVGKQQVSDRAIARCGMTVVFYR